MSKKIVFSKKELNCLWDALHSVCVRYPNDTVYARKLKKKIFKYLESLAGL